MQLTTPPVGVTDPQWSPDGTLIVFTEVANGKKGSIYVVPSSGGGMPMLIVGGDSSLSLPTWSADGNTIAYAGCGTCTANSANAIWLFDLKTQHATKVPGSDGFTGPRWSHNGRYIGALTTNVRTMMLYDLTKRTWSELTTGFEMGWTEWSHDSKWIYVKVFGPAPVRIVRVNISTRKTESVVSLQEIRTATYPTGDAGSDFRLTPDDRVLVTRDVGADDIYALTLSIK